MSAKQNTDACVIEASVGVVTVTLPRDPPPECQIVNVKRERDGDAIVDLGNGRIVRVGPGERVSFRAEARPAWVVFGIVLRKAKTVWKVCESL